MTYIADVHRRSLNVRQHYLADSTPIPRITLRQFERLIWVNPRHVLVNLRNLELNLPAHLDDRTRRLRTNDLKKWREARTAALFAYGIVDICINAIRRSF